LRVEEAAAVLRIGRTTAYAMAADFLATDGASGLPVVRVGKQLRVPRCRVEDLLGGPITWPPVAKDARLDASAPPDQTPPTSPPRPRRRRGDSSDQRVLSFPA
jgi:excisionase family DNA binding protein